jgi:hypothetical protein
MFFLPESWVKGTLLLIRNWLKRYRYGTFSGSKWWKKKGLKTSNALLSTHKYLSLFRSVSSSVFFFTAIKGLPFIYWNNRLEKILFSEMRWKMWILYVIIETKFTCKSESSYVRSKTVHQKGLHDLYEIMRLVEWSGRVNRTVWECLLKLRWYGSYFPQPMIFREYFNRTRHVNFICVLQKQRHLHRWQILIYEESSCWGA